MHAESLMGRNRKSCRTFYGLKTLRIGINPITDAGLVHLKPFTGLRELELNATNVTGSGVENLKKQ